MELAIKLIDWSENFVKGPKQDYDLLFCGSVCFLGQDHKRHCCKCLSISRVNRKADYMEQTVCLQ